MADEEKTREQREGEKQPERLTDLGPLSGALPAGASLPGPLLDGVPPLRLFNRPPPTALDRFQLLVDHAPIGIVITRALVSLYVNPAYLRMFGLGSLSDLKALSPLDLVAPESRSLVAERMRLRSEGLLPSESFEAVGLRRDGTRFPFYVEVAEIEWEGEPATVAFVFDVSASVRLREEFLATAAHELRTPLTALLGHAQLLRRRITRASADERDLRALHVIVDQASRLNNMVAALLDLTRLNAGQLTIAFEPLDLAALVRGALDTVVPATRRHALHLDLPDEPPTVVGDAARLTQLIQHLVGNAIKYSPAGGNVAVRLESADGWAILSVADQGIGIPADALPLLFRRFYRAPNAQQISGLGIGLHLIQEIVTLHGGEIAVDSREGQGSTFTVRLPMADS
ncbi:MAG TPA: HAMP domain-containing sensor histidine kinase [Roseiflexaceae bacterium]|nr:HAMP domain-containing sensor histidine kinase [Roseiflexaceae bacterium]